MKAIQVKYIGATPSKPSRMKVFVEGGYAYCEAQDSRSELDEQAEKMAKMLMSNLRWDNVEITGKGILPNGDWVFTVGAKA